MEPINIDVRVTARPQSPLYHEFSSTVVINMTRDFEEYIADENDGSLTSLGFYPAPFSPCPTPQILLQLKSFEPNDVYQVLFGRFHDHVLSKKISDEIVVEAQRGMSEGFKQPLFIEVFVKHTEKVFHMVLSSDPSPMAPEFEKTCAICLEKMWGGFEDYIQMPNCSHCFHAMCVMEWLVNLDNNSCPLCRQPLE